jgi:hypothetical protein
LQLTINHRVKNGIFHVEIISIAPATTIKDHFGMTWEDENHSDRFWGKCLRKSRMINLETFVVEGEGSEEDKAFLIAKKKLKPERLIVFLLKERGVRRWFGDLRRSNGSGTTPDERW